MQSEMSFNTPYDFEPQLTLTMAPNKSLYMLILQNMAELFKFQMLSQQMSHPVVVVFKKFSPQGQLKRVTGGPYNICALKFF